MAACINFRVLYSCILKWYDMVWGGFSTHTSSIELFSTWGASANTLRSSALVLCYSAAEYCAPVWSRSAHTSQIDVQLNSTMHLISGTLRSTPLQWLPVLSNIEPPALRKRLPLTSWWRKLSNMTVGQSSLISSPYHCYDWHPGSRCSWTCNQLTSKVDGAITGIGLRWSILT